MDQEKLKECIDLVFAASNLVLEKLKGEVDICPITSNRKKMGNDGGPFLHWLFLYYTREKSKIWYFTNMKYYFRISETDVKNNIQIGIGLACNYNLIDKTYLKNGIEKFKDSFSKLSCNGFKRDPFFIKEGEHYLDMKWDYNENIPTENDLSEKLVELITATKRTIDIEIDDNKKSSYANAPSSTTNVQKKETKKQNMYPLNQILYGPPGTGKTYNSIDQAVKIASPDQYSSNKTDSHIKNKIVFDDLRKQGIIEFVTFHQNYSYEDFVVGITPDVATDTLRFEKREGIFKKLVERSKQNWLAHNKKAIYFDFNYVFNSFFSELIQEVVTEVEIPMKREGWFFKITSIEVEKGRIKFTKQSGGKGHDLLKKNLEAIYEGNIDYANEGLGVYYYPLAEKLKSYAEKLLQPETSGIPLKSFVLIIDEINRANISKVFGELITLLEDDKRLGAENELKITLPNGEKDFGVPPNLYLIGTMNTADKSIALIDIALRRRFEFVGYYPKYKLEGLDKVESLLLEQINKAVYKEKKSADYLIGHAYFMKKQKIETVLLNKVVPLLMEYFSGKTDIVSRIFMDTDWNATYDETNFSWNIEKK